MEHVNANRPPIFALTCLVNRTSSHPPSLAPSPTNILLSTIVSFPQRPPYSAALRGYIIPSLPLSDCPRLLVAVISPDCRARKDRDPALSVEVDHQDGQVGGADAADPARLA